MKCEESDECTKKKNQIDRIPNMIRFDVLLKLFKYEINEFTPKEESDEN